MKVCDFILKHLTALFQSLLYLYIQKHLYTHTHTHTYGKLTLVNVTSTLLYSKTPVSNTMCFEHTNVYTSQDKPILYWTTLDYDLACMNKYVLVMMFKFNNYDTGIC